LIGHQWISPFVNLHIVILSAVVLSITSIGGLDKSLPYLPMCNNNRTKRSALSSITSSLDRAKDYSGSVIVCGQAVPKHTARSVPIGHQALSASGGTSTHRRRIRPCLVHEHSS